MNKEESSDNLMKIVIRSLEIAEKNNYRGWDKMDAMNSRFLNVLSFNNKYLKIIYTQVINRFPLNLRGVFGVSKQFNPKAGGLVLSSYCKMYRITGDKLYLDKAHSLIDMLLDFKSERHEICWGYGHEWQSTAFHREKYEPNAVATLYVAFSFLDFYELTNDSTVKKLIKSISIALEEYFPVLFEDEENRAISYIEIAHSGVILNIQSLYSIFLVRYSDIFKDNAKLELAKKHLNYVISKKTDYDAWYYADPPEKSMITHDNYHTGYILDSLLEYYKITNDQDILNILDKGFTFFKKFLYTSALKPKWMYDTVFPMDIHSAAQGIITFSNFSIIDESSLEKAEKIAEWVLEHLYDKKSGKFHYQKRRYITYRHKLFRWNDAWMIHALTSLIVKKMEIPE